MAKDLEIVSAGHTCLDIIPAFTLEEDANSINEVVIPGKMIDMGKCVVVGGGPVTNAGVSIRRLGVKTELIGKLGDDDFGKMVQRWYDEHECRFDGIRVVPGESTSYTIAICIPGIDRSYLHHCGANDTFGFEDMDFRLVERAKMMLFGYPPWMKKLYQDDGAELTKILTHTRELGTTVTLDLALPDLDSAAGDADWRKIMEQWVPLCDIMVPSAEELFCFLNMDGFLAKRDSLGPKETILDKMTVEEITWMGDELMKLGTGVAMIKCGNRGLYVRTADKARLEKFGASKPGDVDNWANREMWQAVFEEESFVGALGSGDSAIAGFVSAFVWEHSIEDCMRYANAAGSMNVTVPDGLSWNKGFDDLTKRIEAGWKTKSMQIDAEGWEYDGEFWQRSR